MESNKKLLLDLQASIKDPETFSQVSKDFTTTFERLGVGNDSRRFTEFVLDAVQSSKTIENAEKQVKTFFESEKIDGKTVFEIISASLEKRIEIMFGQLKPYFVGTKGDVIDYGCGGGLLTQMLHDSLGIKIEGVDVRDFRSSKVSVPVKIFDGYRVPVADKHYECAVLTNVIHHELDNEKILAELDRIVSKKMVIIETVPEADDDEAAKDDWGRMILNDALWNRFFNYANIPVPGTYETPFTWVQRFEKYGWKCTHSEDLGFDQPTIQDRHHLLVFER
jgi:SAM-dependent methyltransferase